jgi:hypothetical protein
VQFLAGEEARVDQGAVDGGKGECFEAVHRPVTAVDVCGFGDQQQVLDADAVRTLFVVTWLVGEDHARFQRHVCPAFEMRAGPSCTER